MKKRTPDKFWFPWWPDKWIFGSVRIECSIEERAIWVDLLSLASKDDGFIRANEETPYPLSQLSGMLIIPEKILSDAIEKFIKLGKLIRTKEGTLYIAKWDKYQFSERHKRRVDGEMAEKEDTKAEEGDAIRKKKILDKKKEDENKEYEEIFNEEWSKWPSESQAKKKICRTKFIALCKAGKYEEYFDIRKSYFDYLRMQHQKTGFEQRPMHVSTWLNNWEDEKERYKGIKYKPPL